MTVFALLSKVPEPWKYKTKEITFTVLKMATIVSNAEWDYTSRFAIFPTLWVPRFEHRKMFQFTFGVTSSQCFSWLPNCPISGFSPALSHKISFSGLHQITLTWGRQDNLFCSMSFSLSAAYAIITVGVVQIMTSLVVSHASLLTWILLLASKPCMKYENTLLGEGPKS